MTPCPLQLCPAVDHLIDPASAAPCSAHHTFTAQSAHPGQQRAPRTARSSRVRLDGMGAKRLCWLLAWCWPGAGRALLFTIIFHGGCQLAVLGQADTRREEDGYTQTITAAAATCFTVNQVPNKLVDAKMLEAMLAMFVLAQRPSVSMGKNFRVIMMLRKSWRS